MHTIGFVPGAMKPFHAGHNHLIQTALKECDKVLVFTSLKDRGVIKGDKMYKAWQELISWEWIIWPNSKPVHKD